MARAPAKKKFAPVEDLSALDNVIAEQEKGRLIPLLHMDGRSPLGFSVRIAGPDSERWKQARNAMQAELIARESIEPLTPEERNAQGRLFVARVTLGFEPEVKMDGQQLENNESNILRVYNRFGFIYKQVDEVAGEREGFLSAAGLPLLSQSEDEPKA